MWNCRPGPSLTVDGYKSSMALQKFLLCVFNIKDGGSVFFMAAKAEVLEKQISRAAKIDLISLDRCADASVS